MKTFYTIHRKYCQALFNDGTFNSKKQDKYMVFDDKDTAETYVTETLGFNLVEDEYKLKNEEDAYVRKNRMIEEGDIVEQVTDEVLNEGFTTVADLVKLLQTLDQNLTMDIQTVKVNTVDKEVYISDGTAY